MKKKAEIREDLIKQESLPEIIAWALKGDVDEVAQLLRSGQASLADTDAKGRTLIDYINSMGLWDFLHRLAKVVPKLLVDVKVTEQRNLAAWICEEQADVPQLLRFIPWDELDNLTFEVKGDTYNAVDAISEHTSMFEAVEEAVRLGNWKITPSMTHHMSYEQSLELAGYSRDEDVLCAALGEGVTLVELDQLEGFVGEVVEKLDDDDYESFDGSSFIVVKANDGERYVLYMDNNYSVGDPFTLLSPDHYTSPEQSAYAW